MAPTRAWTVYVSVNDANEFLRRTPNLQYGVNVAILMLLAEFVPTRRTSLSGLSPRRKLDPAGRYVSSNLDLAS